MQPPAIDLLNLGKPGCSLRVSVAPRQVGGTGTEPWFDTAITVDAHPFRGKLETTFTRSDFRDWARSLRGRVDLSRVVLGGDRAAELALEVRRQQGGTRGALAVEVTLTPSGDDPYPQLRFLLFEVAPFAEEVAARIDALCEQAG